MAQDNLHWLKDFLQDDLYLLPGDNVAIAPSETAAVSANQQPEITEPIAIPAEQTKQIIFNCLGPADSGFLILTHYPGEEYIAAAHLQPLEGILGRKNITTGGFTILNLAKQDVVSFNAIIQYFVPQRLLIMGADAIPDGLQMPALNTALQMADVKVLYTNNFEEMLPSDEKKRAFWAEMKNF
ncbi:hypothetical protein [Mucilaginibacter ginkgonis]|uniref:Uncharacterized protein n=1 Tax=Mucilaginibacter ginkgonis TaxID=2682091 RepID=A0A6I4I2F3_9SPHI|nr:hypothetical protein [Mucilaginibacter ginkgonis]QQL49203.1 hypothetical protein GO620_013600 [Mucilaginibacter ginkgonis]